MANRLNSRTCCTSDVRPPSFWESCLSNVRNSPSRLRPPAGTKACSGVQGVQGVQPDWGPLVSIPPWTWRSLGVRKPQPPQPPAASSGAPARLAVPFVQRPTGV
jgi:hypothetical protein